MYFNDAFPVEFGVKPRADLRNAPMLVRPSSIVKFPRPGKPLEGEDLDDFVQGMAAEIAKILGLEKKIRKR